MFDGVLVVHANKAMVSAIAEVSSQVSDVSYKCGSYAECSFIE